MTGPLGAPGFFRRTERQDVVVETSTLKVIFRNVAVDLEFQGEKKKNTDAVQFTTLSYDKTTNITCKSGLL